MKTKAHKTLALVATVAALCGITTYGQSSAPNTNALVIAATAAATADSPTLDISPEIRTEMLRAAASEIGAPEPGDHDDLLARHAALKQQILVIQQRHPRATTNAPAVPAPSAPPAARPPPGPAPASAPAIGQPAAFQPAAFKRRQPAPSEQLARIISELSEIRAQLTDKVATPVAQ